MISTVVFAGEVFCLADAPDWEDEPPKLVSCMDTICFSGWKKYPARGTLC